MVSYCCCLFAPESEKLILVYTGSISEEEVTDILKSKLQDYMVPAKVVRRDQMLFSINGKIDRLALSKEYL